MSEPDYIVIVDIDGQAEWHDRNGEKKSLIAAIMDDLKPTGKLAFREDGECAEIFEAVK